MSLDLDRLKKFMLVMLSSDKPGEVMAASAMVVKALKKEGRDIHWLVDQIAISNVRQPTKPAAQYYSSSPAWASWAPDGPDWRDMLSYCRDRVDRIARPRDHDFILSLWEQARPEWFVPSMRQEQWLRSIYDRLRVYA